MLRSLHIKLVLIMILLVVCLMAIAGAFLINSVNRFYLNEFYTQMVEVFSEDTEFVRDLVTAREGEQDGGEAIDQILLAKMGPLGVDGKNRNYYILDGETAEILASSDDDGAQTLEKLTPNLLIALNEKREGNESDLTANYMDLALPIQRGGQDYIIYILDQRATVRELNSQLFQLIIEALAFGLIISVLLSFLLSRAMVTPIRALTRGAQRVAEGDFDHKIQVESHDEIGVLTNAFNAMAGQLQATLQAVDSERTKLSTLFLHMTDGVVAFNQSGEVIHANPAAEEMLDMEIPLGGTVTYQDLFGEIAPLETILTLERDCLESETVRGERTLLFLLAPFDREKQVGVLVVVHDVTQQVKNETMRKEFVANVSHELKTPLTVILSNAELLEGAGLAEKPARWSGNIHTEAEQMRTLVEQMLTLARADNGVRPAAMEPLNLSDVATDCVLAFEPVAFEAGKPLEERIAADITVVGDADRLRRLISILLDNAVKYGAEGGHITLTLEKTDRQARLTVSNPGDPIPPEHLAHLFERFYRADASRGEKSGFGLGLAIADTIAWEHKGALKAESDAASTRFIFTMPLKKQA